MAGEIAGKLRIMNQIREERERQDAQWGGAEHDDLHSASQWSSFRGKFENKQLRLVTDPRAQRAEVVKIAALAVAQIESLDREILREIEDQLSAARRAEWDRAGT